MQSDQCSFPNGELRIERPNSTVTRFVISRTDVTGNSNYLYWLIPGLILGVGATLSIFLAVVLSGLWFLIRVSRQPEVVEECAEVFSGVALQLSAKFADGSTSHRMVPLSEIGQVVLNETAAGFYIRTYLAVLPARTGAKLILPFEHTDLPIWLSSKLLFSLRSALA